MYIRSGMDHSETSTNSSASEPQMGQTKSAGSSSQVMVKTQLLQAYFFITAAPLRLTVAAQTGEGQLAAFDMAAGAGSAELRGNRDLMHVHDCIAAGADEMHMGLGVGIETLRAVYRGNAGDLPLLFEKRQIPVDCCL